MSKRKIKLTVNCKHCQNLFVQPTVNSKFCSSICADRFRRPPGGGHNLYRKLKRAMIIMDPRECKNCSEVFVPRNKGSKTKYCDKCKVKCRRKKYADSNKDILYAKKINSIKELGNNYVKDRLRLQGIYNPTPEIVDEKRLTLKIKRKADENTKRLDAQRNNVRIK